MKSNDADPPYETLEIGTPRDYSSDIYKVYFEVGNPNSAILNLLTDYMGVDKGRDITVLTHGYELELPIQVVPEVVRLLSENNIGVYQVVRYAKTNSTWS
jgi:hypothetical protein